MLPEDPTPDPGSEPIPPALADVLLPALLLPRIAAQLLFALPGDPVPQAVTRLCGLTQGDVMRLASARDADALALALAHEPAAFYYFALVGWLAFDSPLGETVADRMANAGTEAQARMLAVAAAVVEGLLPLLADCVPGPATAATTAALRELFAQEKHGLMACLPAIVPPAAAPAEVPAEVLAEDDVWLTMRAEPSELYLFGLALTLTHTASYGLAHPLARALPGVSGLGTSAELVGLARRLAAAQPPPGAADADAADAPAEELALNGPDLIRLYLSLQVLALLFVADLAPVLLARLSPAPNPNTDPWHDLAQQHDMLHHVCSQVEAFGMLFDDIFGEEPAYIAAKATARGLAALV